MKTTSADLLEFEALKSLLGRFVSSPLGRVELEKVAPGSDLAVLTEALAEAEEAIGYLRSAAQPKGAQRGAAIRLDFSPTPDLRLAAEKLRIEGATLEPREIFDVIALLDRAADFKSILSAVAERFPRLGKRALSIGEFRPVLQDVAGKVLPDGSIADSASVALARLRREIEKQKKSIHESLERFLRAHKEEGVLQEEIVTIRNERFVVPVISGQRKKVSGVIHGASSSGHTLFVEPLETIELNNDLVRLGEEEMRESNRILREITERLRGYAGSIKETLNTMAALELVFAKARFALEFDCVIPRFGTKLRLRDARHPLLQDVLKRQRKTIVPISLELDSDCRTLLISGPNTGGKTVSIKTVGLLALMAQAGLPVPCAEMELPVFEQVLADIGDNQSIQESLSTFSSHISRIREMALDVTPDSLVLLDELGAATDPEEGGALGVALVEHFRAAGAFTMISTHLLALKIYGATTPGVLNASMGFDEQTLEPTYQLRTGAPGKSAGLDIATRLGMPGHIMERARQSMSTRERDLATFLSELHRRLEATAELEGTLRSKVAELAEREKALARDWEKRESAKLKELERRCDQVLDKFEADSRETIERIRLNADQRKAADHAARGVAKVKRELREEFQNEVLTVAAGTPAEPPLKIEEGARVRLKGVSEPARVRRKLGVDRIEVDAGFLKMQVSIDDVLEVLPAGGESRKLPKNVSFRPAPQFAPTFQEINVIGEHAEEAIDRVEKFLDSAVMATASRVRIVHGHGMGVLRKAIWELLKSSPHVEKFYQAPQNEGGAGATIAESEGMSKLLRLGYFFFALGGVGLLLFGILDSSFLFLPLGNDLLVVALTASKPHHMLYYAAMATVGSTIGVALAHVVASRTGKKAIEANGKSRKVAFVERKVKQYGGLAIAAAALAPPGFPFTAFIVASAALQFPLRKMLAIIASCRLVRYLLVGYLALVYGRRILEMAKSPAVETFLVALIVVSVAGSVFSIWGWVKKGRA